MMTSQEKIRKLKATLKEILEAHDYGKQIRMQPLTKTEALHESLHRLTKAYQAGHELLDSLKTTPDLIDGLPDDMVEVGVVTNDNVGGWDNVITTPPNYTLPIGTPVYARCAPECMAVQDERGTVPTFPAPKTAISMQKEEV